jgi:hypothetical protein
VKDGSAATERLRATGGILKIQVGCLVTQCIGRFARDEVYFRGAAIALGSHWLVAQPVLGHTGCSLLVWQRHGGLVWTHRMLTVRRCVTEKLNISGVGRRLVRHRTV